MSDIILIIALFDAYTNKSNVCYFNRLLIDNYSINTT